MTNKMFSAIHTQNKLRAKSWIDKQPRHIKKIIGEYISNYIVPQARASAIKEGLQYHNEHHELGFNRHHECDFCNLESTVRTEITEPIRASAVIVKS